MLSTHRGSLEDNLSPAEPPDEDAAGWHVDFSLWKPEPRTQFSTFWTPDPWQLR